MPARTQGATPNQQYNMDLSGIGAFSRDEGQQDSLMLN